MRNKLSFLGNDNQYPRFLCGKLVKSFCENGNALVASSGGSRDKL